MNLFSPLSDLINLIDQARRLLVDARTDFLSLSRSLERPKLEDLRKNIRNLYFPPDGMLGSLREFNQKQDTMVLRKLEQQYDESEDRVRVALKSIDEHLQEVGKHSLRSYDRLKNLTYGFAGKNIIRRRIQETLQRYANSESVPEHEDLFEDVAHLINAIEEFNAAPYQLPMMTTPSFRLDYPS